MDNNEMCIGCGMCCTVRNPRGCPFLSKDYRCLIYPIRPPWCRTFKAGSVACLALREKAGLIDNRKKIESLF